MSLFGNNQIPKNAKFITGIVKDDLGPVAGAYVQIFGTKREVITNFDGEFSIKAAIGEAIFVYYEGGASEIILIGNKKNYLITLKAELNEVVLVTDAFKKDKLKITSAIPVVKNNSIQNETPYQTFQNALQGRASGVQVTATNGKPGQKGYVTIRGNVSITGNYNGATYIVDGEFVSEQYASSLNPKDVSDLSILKLAP